MGLFGRCIFVSSVLVVASCHNPASPPFSPVVRESAVIGDNVVRLAASVSAREVSTGAPITLRIVLTNEGTQAVTLNFNSGCQILPYIHDRRGAHVIPGYGGYVCTAALTNLTLTPRQSVTREEVWTGSTDFGSNMPLRPLPPGRYYFTAEVPSQQATLRSPPIELIVK